MPFAAEVPADTPTDEMDRLALLELALESADSMTWVWEIGTDRLTWIGRGVDFMFGMDPAVTSVTSRQFLEFVHSDDRRMILEKVSHIVTHGGSLVTDYRAQREDGELCWHLYRAKAVFGDEGTVVRVIGVTQDITDRRQTEDALRQSEQQLRTSEEHLQSVLAGAPLAIVAVDTGGTVTMAQGSALDVIHVQGERLLGSPVRDMLHDYPEALVAVEQALAGEVVNARLDVSDVTFDASYRPLLDGAGDVIGAVIVATDVTEKTRAEDQLARLALHDSLTGLANRVLFNDRLELHLARSVRRHGSTAVLFLDLDRFKHVNDTHGHHIGDELLRGVANRLSRSVRPEDTIARFGGDEFLVLGEVANATEAEAMARRIVATVSEPIHVGDLVLQVGVSIGVAIAGPPVERNVVEAATSLVRQADTAMYKAKRAGRGRYVIVANR